MMNIAADVKEYLDNIKNLSLFAPIGLDAFGVAKEALIVRADPSAATITEYIDGSTTGVQALSFYARSKSAIKARTSMDKIRKALDKPEITLTDVLCIKVVPRTLPAITGKEETGESIYTMTVDVFFDGQNPAASTFKII